MMRRSVLGAVMPAALLLLLLPGSASAFPLTTCSLELESLGAGGATIDTASSGAADSTQADPFEVEWEGSVAYDGTTNVVIKNYTYSISVFNVPTPLQGGGTNDDENTDGNGTVSVAANSPFRAAGLYYVSGTYTGEGGTCTGSGWFRLLGDPVGTVPWIAGLVLAVLGLLGYIGGLRGSLVLSLIGGLLLGLGADLLLISYAVLPLAELTPLVVLLGAIVVGILLWLIASRGRGGAEGAPVEA
jgi:hypothetical protein